MKKIIYFTCPLKFTKVDLNESTIFNGRIYRDKICVYDEHPIAGRDIQYRAPDSRSRYATPLDDIIK